MKDEISKTATVAENPIRDDIATHNDPPDCSGTILGTGSATGCLRCGKCKREAAELAKRMMADGWIWKRFAGAIVTGAIEAGGLPCMHCTGAVSRATADCKHCGAPICDRCRTMQCAMYPEADKTIERLRSLAPKDLPDPIKYLAELNKEEAGS